MDGFARAIILSWGWRRRGIALLAGALSALAMPPFFLFPVLWLTFPVLVWLIDGAVAAGRRGSLRRFLPAFGIGWWFGFGYFAAGLWWVGAAFLVEAEVFAWALPIAVLALPAGLALFWGLGAALAQPLWGDGPGRIFALAVGLGLAEWLRGHVLWGFPWNAIGYALTAGEVMMQSAALFGLYGLNVLAVIVFAAPAALAPRRAAGAGSWVLPGLSAATVAGLATFGLWRLGAAGLDVVPDVRVRLVQPAIAQDEKWQPGSREMVMRAHLDLSAPEGRPLQAGDLVVWPETALPLILTETPEALQAIADLLPEGARLVTGATRVERVEGAPVRAFNSLYVLDDEGVVADAYDKVNLVPFGEFLPFQDWLESLGLQQLTRMRGGFDAGSHRRMLSLDGLPPFQPLVCYEIIFSGAVRADGARPGFLLNVTNDAWFGRTPGPYQHLHQARLRAVEEGLPLVRAANSGVSVVTDGYGRILQRAPLGARATLDAPLPAPGPETPFARTGGMSFLFLIFASFLMALTALFSRHQNALVGGQRR